MPRQKKQRLKRRKDGRYCCTYQGIQFMGVTEEEALEKREEYKRNKTRPRTMLSVLEYAAYWLPIHKAGVKATTYNSYASVLTAVVDPIKTIPLSRLTSDHVSEAYSKLTGKSASYIHKAKILLTAMLDSAEDAKYIESNPARAKSVKPPQGKRGTHRAITDEERALILNTRHPFQFAALIMLFCGLRRGELIGLKAEDIQGDTLTVRRAVYYVSNQPVISDPKTQTSVRSVPVPEIVLQTIPQMEGECYLLTGTKKPMTEQVFTRAWSNYTKAVGVSVRCHDLRHSYCTWLRDSGIDIHQAIIWMGHADEKMILRIYDHPGTERETDAKNLLKTALSMQIHMQENPQSSETQTGSGL